jgi:hypothetical protein
MTTQQPPGWPAQPVPPAPARPPKRPFYKRPAFFVILALVGAALIGLIILGALLSAVGESIEDAASPAQDSIKTQPTDPPTAADPAPSTVDVAPVDRYDTPKVADFRLKVIETGREHFGSAGDNVEY